MSRLTFGNIVKLGLALFFFIFASFYVLIIGVAAKNKRVIVEGAIYAAMFSLAMVLTWAESLAALLGLLSLGASAVRSFMLRDLWLPKRNRGAPQQFDPVRPQPPIQPPAQQSQAPAPIAPVKDDLSPSLAWVSSHAKQNKHRLPADSYVTILETCHTLDAVIDAERRQPTADATFEYELTAMVREYLPSVVQGYLAVPGAMANDKQPNGKTPNEELADQLQLLSGQADSLHASRHSHTSAELTTTGNFLRQRFGHHQRDGFDFGIG
ncbi:hypothetical protein FEF26_13725 [Nesterenkonia salmonea]|uniref:Uncharacterized protein n=1 Tax=Nesterenkonia salmonea TaxID=1804987 RepID=A0A5R9B7J5_9MICC|nr:hypothetical protein [Nesterenkonia salmonea]TLP93293.1 hypothetical protein FEF26_13725 [Nesterenkonia salmonea]